MITVAVSLPLPTHPDIILDAAMITTTTPVKGYFVTIIQDIPNSPHLQTVHNTHVRHDGDCGLSWTRILQECEARQSTGHGHVVIAVSVAETGTGLVF